MNSDQWMLILHDIRKSYERLEVLKGISMEVKKGELVTFVGPSGCGKTTLLRVIGGFTNLDSGEVVLDGQRIDHLPPNLRDTRICFQNYASVSPYDRGSERWVWAENQKVEEEQNSGEGGGTPPARPAGRLGRKDDRQVKWGSTTEGGLGPCPQFGAESALVG